MCDGDKATGDLHSTKIYKNTQEINLIILIISFYLKTQKQKRGNRVRFWGPKILKSKKKYLVTIGTMNKINMYKNGRGIPKNCIISNITKPTTN